MARKWLRFRITEGSITPTRKHELRDTLFTKGVKFSKIVETKDTFVVVCFEENGVDLVLANDIKTKLIDLNLEVVIPPNNGKEICHCKKIGSRNNQQQCS